MGEKTLIIEGYQPTVRVQDGYQPKASVQNIQNVTGQNHPKSTPIVVNIVPPKGGTGEVKSNKK